MTAAKTKRTFIVTSAPPNPNGDLHLGHLSGPFLGADVMQRHLKQLGHEVRYVGYSDEHSCYVPRRGAELGRTAHETARVFGNRMEETLSLGAMHHDWFTRPLTNSTHTEIVQRFFLELWEQGAFEVQELPVFHCTDCDRPLYEAEVRGECHYCGDPSDGIYCEACGLPQVSGSLAAPKCTACWNEPELRSMRRIVFKLEGHREALAAYFADAQSRSEWRPRLVEYLDGLMSRPLPETPVSREGAYGIPVPLDGWEGHYLDTWFSGIWGYVAATANLTAAQGEPGRWEELWTSPDTEVFNFIGFDCGFSHAVLWPALLIAHGGLTLPSQVVTNEFYRLEGEKFSTSRGHAIWGGDFLRRVSPDALRFHLCLTGPEREQTNFAMAEFADTVSTILVAGIEEWSGQVVDLLTEDFDGVLPKTEGPLGPLAHVLSALPGRVGDALAPETFSPQRAAAVIAETVAAAVADLRAVEALRSQGGPGYVDRLATHLELLATLAAVAQPLMPGWSSFLLAHLKVPAADLFTGRPVWPAADQQLLVPGQVVDGSLPAFFHLVAA